MTSKVAAVVLSGVLILGSCSSDEQPASSVSAQESSRDVSNRSSGGKGRGNASVVPVETAQVTTKPIPITIPAVGTVEAISTVQIRSQAAGQLISIGFKEGDEVRKGQLLFALDARPFQAALAEAQAALERDTATANNQRAQLTRQQRLFDRGIIARDQYEMQDATAKSSEAVVSVDKAAVDAAQLNLQYARITAPISGRAGSLGVHVGDIVHPTDAAPMVTVNQVAPIYVSFSVPGKYLADIRRYQREHPLRVEGRIAPATLPGAQPPAPSVAAPDVQPEPPGQTEEGLVTFIDNAVDTTTGTIKLRGTFDNADRTLWPGLFLQVDLQLRTEVNAIVVPAAAVQVSQNGNYVYVVKPDDTVEMRPVSIERQQGNEIVIAKGLSGGEQIVTDGQLRLTPGAHVDITRGRGDTASE